MPGCVKSYIQFMQVKIYFFNSATGENYFKSKSSVSLCLKMLIACKLNDRKTCLYATVENQKCYLKLNFLNSLTVQMHLLWLNYFVTSILHFFEKYLTFWEKCCFFANVKPPWMFAYVERCKIVLTVNVLVKWFGMWWVWKVILWSSL